MRSITGSRLAAITLGSAVLLGCAAKEKEAVGPNDKLLCEAADTTKSETTLGSLYASGWHLIESAFYNGNRQVLYFEK
jgi:hypothetical protein